MTGKETRSLREKPSWSLKTLVRDCTNTGLGANVSLLLQGSTLQVPTTTTATSGITDQRYRCLSLTEEALHTVGMARTLIPSGRGG